VCAWWSLIIRIAVFSRQAASMTAISSQNARAGQSGQAGVRCGAKLMLIRGPAGVACLGTEWRQSCWGGRP
jgi:hypothetical protein